ncbi:phage tail fiber protein [Paracidovorax oryzae]|uniref:phage tail fiber protein n=1 Tax=Paracidovorax oryzae TaxID=862720 RepID=UPI00030F62E4|nr:hypothetical protein [Paracidovorax oryzae]
MAGFSNSLANAIINATLRQQAFPAIRTPYFALFTSDPTDAFTAGTEVNAAWYRRVPTGAFAAPVNGGSYNAVRAAFPPVTGAQTTVTHIGIVEGDSLNDPTATLMYSEALPAPRTLQINDVFVVDSQALAGDFALQLL